MLMAAAVGCGAGDGLNRRAVSGDVSLDGRPLARGVLLFDPISTEASTAVGARIRDGRFAIPRREGPVPGRYAVRIYASSRIQAPPIAGSSPLATRPMVDLIPERYNARSTLNAEIGSRDASMFHFRLSSDASSQQSR
jgi:hypothetical protein